MRYLRLSPWQQSSKSQPSNTPLITACICDKLQMARTQKNKATMGHLGMLKVGKQWLPAAGHL
jgi:hypothetical protein